MGAVDEARDPFFFVAFGGCGFAGICGECCCDLSLCSGGPLAARCRKYSERLSSGLSGFWRMTSRMASLRRSSRRCCSTYLEAESSNKMMEKTTPHHTDHSHRRERRETSMHGNQRRQRVQQLKLSTKCTRRPTEDGTTR